jgi:acetyltransferase-like isoleucine patch superfamily enzyme
VAERNQVQIHETADISPDASIGSGTRIWHQAQVREDAQVGRECILGKGVYVDFQVIIGDRVKVQNYACLYHGTRIESGAFIGPHVCIINDKYPRATTPDGRLKTDADWEVKGAWIKEGASVGTRSVILPGVTVGRYALIGAGSVVTRDIPDHGLALGNPATLQGFVCVCGKRLIQERVAGEDVIMRCADCGYQVVMARALLEGRI